jgi:outer membrane murein-binding lipoprotein Lpp
MFNVNKKILAMTILTLLVAACSSEPKRTELEQQVKAQPAADTPEQIAQRAAEAFSNAPGLTAEQKQKLMVIYSKTYAEAMVIRTEIGQTKSLLFKLIASTSYKSTDVSKLKSKITALDKKRLALMFQALEDVQKIVGYGADKEELYKHLRDYETPMGRAILQM